MNQNFSNESSVQNILPSTSESEYILPAPQTSMPDHQLQAPANDAPREHKKRRSLLALIVAVLVLFFLGGAGYVLAKQGYIELPVPFLEKKPEEVFQRAVEVIKDIQSAHFTARIDSSAVLKSLGSIASPEMFGISNATDEVPPKSPDSLPDEDGGKTALSLSLLTESDWKIGADAGGEQSRIKGTFKWEGLTMEFDIEIKQIGGILYFKMYQMPPIPLLSLFTGGMELKGQWFKIDVKKLAEKGIFYDAPQIGAISGETKQKAVVLLDAFAEALVMEKLKGERLDGVKTYHYGLSFDAEKLKRALTEARAFLPELLSLTKIGKKEAEKMYQEWNKFLEQDYEKIVVPHLKTMHTEIWIGKKDYFVRKIAVQYALPEVPESTDAAKDEMGVYNIFDALTLAFDYQLSTINVSVAIEPPENPKDLMEELQNGPFGEARTKSRDADAAAEIPAQTDVEDLDSDTLPDELEALFGTNPLNPDTDGDGYKDGEEVENGYNPLGSGKIEKYPMSSKQVEDEIIDALREKNFNKARAYIKLYRIVLYDRSGKIVEKCKTLDTISNPKTKSVYAALCGEREVVRQCDDDKVAFFEQTANFLQKITQVSQDECKSFFSSTLSYPLSCQRVDEALGLEGAGELSVIKGEDVCKNVP